MCAPRVTRHTAIRYSSSCHTHASTLVHRYSSLLQWSVPLGQRGHVGGSIAYFARNAHCTVTTDLLVWYSNTQNKMVIYTQWHIPHVVLIQLILLMMGTWLPRKHVENRNKHTWKRIVGQVGYLQRLYRDAARSTERNKVCRRSLMLNCAQGQLKVC